MTTSPILTALLLGTLLSAGLTLTSGCTPPPVARTTNERSVDEEISADVKSALDGSASFKFPDVQVLSFNGTVQLSGFVVSAAQKASAEIIAQQVPGVVRVENKISLKQ